MSTFGKLLEYRKQLFPFSDIIAMATKIDSSFIPVFSLELWNLEMFRLQQVKWHSKAFATPLD